MLWAIAFATPFFLFFGWLSDKIGRKWIMMLGMLLGILTYRPIFNTFLKDTDAKEWIKQDTSNNGYITQTKPIVSADSFKIIEIQYDFTDGKKFIEVLKYNPGSIEGIPDGRSVIEYKNKHLSSGVYWKFVALVFLLILYVTMVYGPIAAFLVELFPTKIRYTSMSLPYHIGNGVFGGLVPFIGLLLTTAYPKDPLVGLWYPISVAALCFIIGTIYLSNKTDKEVND